MIVKHFMLNVHEVNVFVAFCSKTREAILIDAGAYDERVADYVREKKLALKCAFITHDHYDHVDGLAEYVEQFDLAVYAGLSPVGRCTAKVVRHGDEIRVGTLMGKIFETPGHTPNGISLAFPGHVFTGDALFAGSVGGTGNPRDYQTQLDAIRKYIFTLPPDTLVHVGHGPSTTVAVENRYNPFFV